MWLLYGHAFAKAVEKELWISFHSLQRFWSHTYIPHLDAYIIIYSQIFNYQLNRFRYYFLFTISFTWLENTTSYFVDLGLSLAEWGFLVLYLWLLALYYLLLFWNTHFFLCFIFCQSSVSITFLFCFSSPLFFLFLPAGVESFRYIWSDFSTKFKIFNFLSLNKSFVLLLHFHFSLYSIFSIFYQLHSNFCLSHLSFYFILHCFIFHLLDFFFLLYKGCRTIVYICFSYFALAFYILNAVFLSHSIFMAPVFLCLLFLFYLCLDIMYPWLCNRDAYL